MFQSVHKDDKGSLSFMSAQISYTMKISAAEVFMWLKFGK